MSDPASPPTPSGDDAFFEGDIFGGDYLYFYETFLTPERTEKEVEFIWDLLGLSSGDAVLDLGCGHGRIANALAARGARVSGLDATPSFLELARAQAGEAGLEVDYRQGDMRTDWPDEWTAAFDAVVLWFTTFGYFDDTENAQVLAHAVAALKSGGRLLIDTPNRNLVHRRPFPITEVTRRDDDLLIDTGTYDGLADRVHTERTIVRDGQTHRTRYAVRLYGPPEFAAMAARAGAASSTFYGGDGKPFEAFGRRLIFVARK